MGLGSKLKTAIKNPTAAAKDVAKVGATVALTGGVGAVAATAEMKKVESTTYTIDKWNPVPSNPSLVAIHFTPALALSKGDHVIISGTPFDGDYKPTNVPTRNDFQIQPGTPVTDSGTTGTFKVKTSIAARAEGGVAATKAGADTTVKKTGDVVKKAAGAFWDKIKMYIYGLLAFLVIGGIIYSLVKAKAAQAVGIPATV